MSLAGIAVLVAAIGVVVAIISAGIATASAKYAKGERDAAREANRLAGEANETAGTAVRMAQQANELTAAANQTTADANRIAGEALAETRKIAAIEEERREVERRREAEEQAAREHAYIELNFAFDRIRVANTAPIATAANVIVNLVGPVGDGRLPSLPPRWTAPEIRAGREELIPCHLNFGDAHAIELTVEWDDLAGHHDEPRTVRFHN